MNFKGFTDSETFTRLPDSFFHHLLSQIEDTAELKVLLYLIWRVEHMDGPFRTLGETDFEPKELGLSAEEVRRGLEKSVERGTLLQVQKDAQAYFFLNSPRGRASAQTFAQARGRESAQAVSAPPVERPNIFKLYEENIGPLTPIIADSLKDAEELYEAEWIADAIEAAVKHNKRNWKYVEAILKRWKEDGRGQKQDRRDDQKDSESLKRKIEQLRRRAS